MSAYKYIAEKARKMFRGFRDESGSGAIEAILLFPAMALIYGSSFVWFDAIRSNTLAMKATYTVSDILSREKVIDNAYLANLNTMAAFLRPSRDAPVTRVTVITHNSNAAQANKYRFRWSYSSDLEKYPEWTQAALDIDTSWIPIMGDDETVVVTETFFTYHPLYQAYWKDPIVWRNVMITRPRFAPILLNRDKPLPGDGTLIIDNEGDATKSDV